eukprot:1186357-Prorocentrum_minimum.AAC.1
MRGGALRVAYASLTPGPLCRSPVNSYVMPIGGATPGYESEVVFADGTFVEGATSELSADGPLREPYVAFCQTTHLSLHPMRRSQYEYRVLYFLLGESYGGIPTGGCNPREKVKPNNKAQQPLFYLRTLALVNTLNVCRILATIACTQASSRTVTLEVILMDEGWHALDSLGDCLRERPGSTAGAAQPKLSGASSRGLLKAVGLFRKCKNLLFSRSHLFLASRTVACIDI